MNPEKRQLIESLTDGQALARREATLLAGARVLRYRRWRRVAGRSLAGVVIIAVAVLSVPKNDRAAAAVERGGCARGTAGRSD